jgi:hypothetical protein
LKGLLRKFPLKGQRWKRLGSSGMSNSIAAWCGVHRCRCSKGHWKWGTFYKIRKLDFRSTAENSLPGLAPSFPKWLSQGGSNKYSPLGLRNHYSCMPPLISHRFFIHGKKQGLESTYSLVYIQKWGTACFHQSRNSISLGSGPLPLNI